VFNFDLHGVAATDFLSRKFAAGYLKGIVDEYSQLGKGDNINNNNNNHNNNDKKSRKKRILGLFKKSSGPFSSFSDSENADQVNIGLGTVIKRFDSEVSQELQALYAAFDSLTTLLAQSSGDVLGGSELSRIKQNPVIGKAKRKGGEGAKIVKDAFVSGRISSNAPPQGFIGS